MYRIHVPFTELICRLIKLNEDRRDQYSFFGRVFNEKSIRTHCQSLSEQSETNLAQLNLLVDDYESYKNICPDFTVSPALWNALELARENNSIHFVASIINKIEMQFGILYQFVCNMFNSTDDVAARIVRGQYEKLLELRARIPNLFLNLN
jgi:hypothetical protein